MAPKSRIILHGKQGANQELRNAVAAVREDGHEVDVRVTWEAGEELSWPIGFICSAEFRGTSCYVA